ncbi:MAG: hypothetical protein CR997_00895 [Acidobacteria bacterium]|nr:MAG: hypothetical protein CR997_00895 [Acidobacteriota bacterium]
MLATVITNKLAFLFAHKAEAQVPVAVIRRIPVAIGRAAVPGVVPIAAPTIDAILARSRASSDSCPEWM